MDVTQAIHAMKGYEHGLAKLDQKLVNLYHLFNETTSRIFFCYYRNTPALMHTITILWKDGKETSVTLIDSNMYRIRFKDRFVKVRDLHVGSKGRFSWDDRKGEIVKKSVRIVSPCYIFTECGRIEINRVLIQCKIPGFLKHTKYTSRISSKLVNPSYCLGMKRFL